MANDEKIIINQFSIDSLSRVPCDSNFLSLLNQVAILKRPYDADIGVKKVNEFGEIIMTHPTAPIISTDLPIRIDPIRQRGELGFKVMTQGGEVFATYRAFVCGETDIRENDIITIATREYQVLLVDDLFDFDRLHHKECWSRRIDNL